jgi:hypothetical protein
VSAGIDSRVPHSEAAISQTGGCFASSRLGSVQQYCAMGGPLMDLYGNPLGAVRTLFDKACRNAASPRDLTRSDWGVQELFQSSLFHHDGHLQVPLSTFPLSKSSFPFANWKCWVNPIDRNHCSKGSSVSDHYICSYGDISDRLLVYLI